MALFGLYLILVIDLGERLVLWPAIVLMPRRRSALVGAWLRFQGWAILALARAIAGVRISVQGDAPAESCLVVMNHQSVLDIPLGLHLMSGPQALIPTRDRYARGVPGISPIIRLAGFPLVAQGRTMTRAELRALIDAAELVARGERSLLIFAEGHRTRDGRIGPFMRSGLRLMLSRAHRPVYCIVADGMTQSRTTFDALAGFAAMRVRVTILGPFAAPADTSAASLDAFIDSLHQTMTDTLARMRTPPPPDDLVESAVGAATRS